MRNWLVAVPATLALVACGGGADNSGRGSDRGALAAQACKAAAESRLGGKLYELDLAVLAAQHVDTNALVVGYVIKGAWRYLEHDWVAREGGYVYEAPGETHTLVVDEPFYAHYLLATGIDHPSISRSFPYIDGKIRCI